MAAIDLLFDVKRESERLHQLVLGVLLQRTTLLSRLVPLGRAPTALQLHWEPDGRAYDLGVSYSPAGAPEPVARSRVLVEIKLDHALNEDRVVQQLSAARLGADDRVLYLLLGYSAITSDRPALRDRLRRIGEHGGIPDLVDRVGFRDAEDLIPLLADPSLLPGGPDHRDVRDLAGAYRDALLSLVARVVGFAGRPVAAWGDGDYLGFFAAARGRGLLGPERARIGRVQGTDGSAVGCTFAPVPLAGGLGHLDLHFENGRLCLRLHAAADRKALRQRMLDVLAAEGHLGESGPYTVAAPRLTSAMTVAERPGLLDAFPAPFDWERLGRQLAEAAAALRKVAAEIRH